MEDKVLGNIIDIPLEATLNTDTVDRDIIPVDQADKFRSIANNGIIRDGGLTEVYKKDDATASSGNVYFTSNGNKIEIKTAADNKYCDIYVNNRLLETIARGFFTSKTNNNYIDFDISNDGLYLYGLRKVTSDSTNIYFTIDKLTIDFEFVSNIGNNFSIGIGFIGINPTICISKVAGGATSFPAKAWFCNSNASIVYCVDTSTSVRNSIFFTTGSVDRVNSISSMTLAGGAICLIVSVNSINSRSLPDVINIAYASSVANMISAPVTPLIRNCNYLAFDGTNILIFNGPYNGGTQTPANYITPAAGLGTLGLTTSAGNICSQFGSVSISDTGTAQRITSRLVGSFGSVSTIGTGIAIPSSTMKSPDAIGEISITVFSSTNYIMSSTINKKSAFLSIISGATSNTRSLSGNALNYIGDLWEGYSPVVSTNKILFKNSDGSFTVTKFETDNVIFNEFMPGVVKINSQAMSIIDTNEFKLYDDYSTYVTSSVLITPYSSGSDKGICVTQNKYSATSDAGESVGQNLSSMVFYPQLSFGTSLNDFIVFKNGTSYSYTNTATLNVTTANNDFTYIPNPYEPIPANLGFDFRNGLASFGNYSAIIAPNLPSYDSANFLLQDFPVGFRLYGQQYAFDGYYIYNIPLSAGSSGQAGTPVIISVANGLQFLCMTPKVAVFYSSFDNSLFAFNGGRDVERIACFSNKPTIVSAKYCTANDELVVQTTSSLMFVRNGVVNEMSPPFTPYTSYELQESNNAVWCVNRTTGAATSYYYQAVSGSVVVPLVWQSGYYGIGSNRRKIVNRIVMRLLYKSTTATTVTIQWNWMTQDAAGTDTATITPVTDAQGYAIFDYNPPNNAVLAGSIGFSTADTTQKIVLLSVSAYMVPEADAQTLNHAT